MDGTFSQVVDEILLIHESFPECEYRHRQKTSKQHAANERLDSYRPRFPTSPWYPRYRVLKPSTPAMKLATSSVREYLAGRTLGDITLVRWQHLARECSSVLARSALSST